MSRSKSLVIGSFIILLALGRIHGQIEAPGILEPIIFAVKMDGCRMFVPSCDVDLLVSKRIDANDWTLDVSDVDVLTVNSIIECVDDVKCSMERFGLNDTRVWNRYKAYTIKIKPGLIGGSQLTIRQKSTMQPIKSYMVVIKQPKRIIDILFDIWIWSFGTFISLLMGILLDRNSLVKIIKMPKAIAIGFSCQYLTMPLLAFAVTRIFKLTPVEALALFIYGCSPGGVGSNNWTILFDGDLDLSAILTFVSTCSSIVMMPAWVYTLGRILTTEAQLNIPIYGLLGNLLITIGPCLLGLLLSYKFPALKKFAIKIAKPFTLFVMISFLILLLVAKFYTFRLVRLRHWYSGPIVPFSGYILGAVVSFIFRLPAKQIKTVAIETGIQNVGVAFLIVYTNLPSPEADYAAFPIFAVAFSTSIPLYLALLVFKIFGCIRNKNKKQTNIDSAVTEKTKTENDIIESEPMMKNKMANNNADNPSSV